MFPSQVVNSMVAFCGFAGVVYAISHLFFNGDHRTQRRVEEASRRFNPNQVPESKLGKFVKSTIGGVASRLPVSGEASLNGSVGQLESRLRHAGFYSRQAQAYYFMATIGLTVLPTVSALSLLAFRLIGAELAFWISLIGGGLGMLAPGFWLDRRKTKRHLTLLKGLPDFLDLMITCLTSGLSLESALQRVSSEIGNAHPVLSNEMARVRSEINLGASVDQALMNFAHRSDCEEILSLATLCQQTRQYGTRISDAFRSHADLLRTKREMRAEERAQKAVVKILIPTLLLIFPSVFVVLAGPAAIQIWEYFGNQ